MEAAEQQTTTAPPYPDCNKDIANVTKGKRTKRQRPQSPIRFAFSSSSNNDKIYSPVSSSGIQTGSITTDEEETAESLILLSRGESLDMTDPWTSKKKKNDYDDGMFKFNSKKFIQSSADGEGGLFVYECKTCGRTFPSFQALGGHRASHKKPRNNHDILTLPPYMNNEPSPPDQSLSRNDHYSSSSSLSFQLNNRISLITKNTIKSSSRLHECSICGTEFNSGQALGGHMRRHRVTNSKNRGGNTNTNTDATALSLIPVTTVEVYDRNSENDVLCLGLDLNLPAPRETATTTQRQNQSLAFSPTTEKENVQQPAINLCATQTLVGCHF